MARRGKCGDDGLPGINGKRSSGLTLNNRPDLKSRVGRRAAGGTEGAIILSALRPGGRRVRGNQSNIGCESSDVHGWAVTVQDAYGRWGYAPHPGATVMYTDGEYEPTLRD